MVKKEKKKEDIQQQISFIETSEALIEQVYDNENGVKFAVYEKGKIEYKSSIWVGDIEFIPIMGEEVYKKAIMLPSKAEEYGTDEELDKEIIEFIDKWLDIPNDVKQFALWNIKRSWVYERFHTLNYLRALGDTGVGKTRFLDVLGHIHYKPIATSGATTAAPIFRMIEKWRGTLIMDEADFVKSDESQDIIKIINMGYEKGKFVMRCEQNDAKKINLFDPYCPKILATRRAFTDKATESRCITQVMQETSRQDIPYNLNEGFFETTQNLRNKLLMWRFRNYHKINPDKKIELGIDLEPRVKQIVNSFISLFGDDKEQLDKFKLFIQNYQEDLIDERRNSFAGQIVNSISNLLEKKIGNITAQDIVDDGSLTDFKGNKLKPRGLSSILKSLGFKKTVMKRIDGKVKRCIPLERELLVKIFKRYGNDVTVVTMYMETEEFQKELQDEKKGGHRNDRYNRYNVTQQFDQKLVQYQKCSIENCQAYETNPDSEGRAFCKDHWGGYAKK